jgi:hypothetical protein
MVRISVYYCDPAAFLGANRGLVWPQTAEFQPHMSRHGLYPSRVRRLRRLPHMPEAMLGRHTVTGCLSAVPNFGLAMIA